MTIGDAGYNRDLAIEVNCIKDLLSRSSIVNEVLKRAPDLQM